ncbi:MAG: N-acetylmuramoyl-L-alanine amidase [Armatimonadetes bacterium]|nr:N-acetylmuramoyl-L-alanine amidase [Armatimonadota bacterium]
MSEMIRATLVSIFVLVASLCLANPVICLDPGHPSEIGPGTKGKHITEMQAVWNVAMLLKPMLEEAGYEVVLTKTRVGQKVTNRERAYKANRAQAAILLRLHCDFAPGESGLATFYASKAGRDGTTSGPSKKILEQVKPMATAFHKAVMGSLGDALENRGVRPETMTAVGAKKGGALIGSIYAKMPSILVEMAVLDNAHDDKFIASEEGQKKVARALCAGVKAIVKVE